MTQPKLLLVSPIFHGYWQTIADSLTKLGYQVKTHVYDAPGNLAERVSNKIIHDLPAGFRPASVEQRVTDKALDVLRDYRPDIVLTVKGDTLGSVYWEALSASGARYASWMYDEMRRMRFTDADYRIMGPIASYSPEDVKTLRARGLDALDVPLAFDSALEIKPYACEDISFVGARYPGREATLRALVEAGIPVRAFGKQWSRHWWDMARTRNFKDSGVPAGRDLDRSTAYGAMQSSPATLNIHGDQDGFTMRTFEAAGVKGLQIIDRLDVERYYIPGEEVLVYTSPEELVEISQRVFKDKAWASKIRQAGYRRTLAEHTFDVRVKTLEQLWV